VDRSDAEAMYGPIETHYNVYWTAIFPDIYDGAPDAGRQFMGHGTSEAEAIAELLEQVEEEEAPDLEHAVSKAEYEEER
jgi:hypothetical protein